MYVEEYQCDCWPIFSSRELRDASATYDFFFRALPTFVLFHDVGIQDKESSATAFGVSMQGPSNLSPWLAK